MAAAESSHDPDRDFAPGTKMALAAMGLGVFVIANDFTALNVALPAIEEEFNVDVGTSQWVINAYAVVFGLAIVAGGRLADMFNRRDVFFVGATLFALFSFIGALSPDIGVLIGSRVGMGIGGALMWPAILGMTYAALPVSRAALAGGFILGLVGVGNAVGPLLGGALTDLFSWRAIFLVNVPIAAIAIAVTWAKLHQPQERVDERIDYAGMATLSLGILLLLVALDQAIDWGFGDWRVIAMLAVSVTSIVAFGVIESRLGSRALVPRSITKNREFMAAAAAVLLTSAVFFVVVLYVPQFLIKVLDYSALEAGLALLPMMVTFAVTSFYSSHLYDRYGPKIVISAGSAALVVGTALLSLIGNDSGYESLVVGLFIIGLGAGLFYSSVTTAAITVLPESQSSLAGGIIYMCQIAGGAVGLATITTIFSNSSERRLSEDAADASIKLTDQQESVMHGLLVGTDSAMKALEKIPMARQEEIVQIVRDSFVAGIQVSFRIVAVVALIGLVVSVTYVGGKLGVARPSGDEQPS